MFEPLANAVHWVQRAGVQLGDTVVVQGPGHQGLACLMAARTVGAGQVIVTGTSGDGLRFDAARALGADAVIDVETEDPITRVAELTNGAMADVVTLDDLDRGLALLARTVPGHDAVHVSLRLS